MIVVFRAAGNTYADTLDARSGPGRHAMDNEFDNKSDDGLQEIIYDKGNGLIRARAIRELARRALTNHDLLDKACRAITSDHKGGMHYLPYGWAGADVIFLSEDKLAMRGLLKEMRSWERPHQETLLSHWNVLDSSASLTDFEQKYDWKIDFAPHSSLQ